MKTLAVLACLTCVATPALSDMAPMPIPPAILNPLFEGYAAGAMCGLVVRMDVAEAYLTDKFGSGVKFNAAQLAAITFAQSRKIAATMERSGDKRRYCGSMLAAFGPRGKQIPGLLGN